MLEILQTQSNVFLNNLNDFSKRVQTEARVIYCIIKLFHFLNVSNGNFVYALFVNILSTIVCVARIFIPQFRAPEQIQIYIEIFQQTCKRLDVPAIRESSFHSFFFRQTATYNALSSLSSFLCLAILNSLARGSFPSENEQTND